MAADGDQFDWVFSDEDMAVRTASRLDGLSETEEEAYRQKTCFFALQLKNRLRMNQLSLWATCILIHRFFTYESFKRRDRLLMAATALFVGGKLAECQRRALDVAAYYYCEKNKTSTLPKPDSEEVKGCMEAILSHEKLLLHTMAFCVNVPIEEIRHTMYSQGSKVRALLTSATNYNKFVQFCSDCLNDLLMKTSLAVRCKLTLLPTIAIYLGLKAFNVPEPKGEGVTSWAQALGIPEDRQTWSFIRRGASMYRPADSANIAARIEKEYQEIKKAEQRKLERQLEQARGGDGEALAPASKRAKQDETEAQRLLVPDQT